MSHVFRWKKNKGSGSGYIHVQVPSLPPVALGLRAAEESEGFLGTLGTLKAAWAEERLPSTLSSSSKLRSNKIKGKKYSVYSCLFYAAACRKWTQQRKKR